MRVQRFPLATVVSTILPVTSTILPVASTILPVASAIILLASSGLVADTVHLKNGRQIEGKITDNRQTSGEVIVEVGTNGRVMLRGGDVVKIEKGEAGEALQRERVAVKLPSGAFYNPTTGTVDRAMSPRSDDKTIVLDLDGGGQARIERRPGVELGSPTTTVEGTMSALSDDKTIVLDLMQGGQVRIERRPGVEVKKIETAAEPRPAAAIVEEGGKKLIRTTHAVYLKNGRKLQGSLVPTAESEPVKLDVGSLGRMTIARGQIAADGIKAEAGRIELPEAPAAAAPGTETPPQAAPPPAEPQTREEMRRQMREEVLRELLEQMIEEKIDAASAQSRATSDAIESAKPQLTPEQVAAIQQEVADLGRQRNQNRVRAERHLVALGADVLPYLEEAATHPFELTRRAVQRIVRDLGALRGAPIAIDALNDPDAFVRALAREALEKILPSTIAYNAEGPEAARLRAQADYQHLWDSMVIEHARDSVLKALAAQN